MLLDSPANNSLMRINRVFLTVEMDAVFQMRSLLGAISTYSVRAMPGFLRRRVAGWV